MRLSSISRQIDKPEKRQKHAARRRNPAAYFLQCAWRVHRSEMRTRNQNRKESVDSDWFSIIERESLLKVQIVTKQF